MRDLKPELVALLKKGGCVPRIADIAKRLRSKSSTIHYNIRQLERLGIVRSYKAVFDYKKIGEGFCTYVLISLDKSEYKTPEEVANMLAGYEEIESVDIITGRWEIIIKVRSGSIEQYYEFAKKVLSMKGIERTETLNSLHQVKTEFVASP